MSAQLIVTPYLRPDPSLVKTSPWMLEGSSEPLGDCLAGWDPATPLLIRRKMRVDVDQILAACHLSRNAKLYAGCFWRASLNSLVGCGSPMPLASRTEQPVDLKLAIPAGQAGGTLSLGTVLCVQDAADTRDPLAPRDPGTILFEDMKSIDLEGVAPRFPVSTVDFTLMGWPRDGAWRLVWDLQDLEVSPTVGMRLYINTLHPLAMSALQGEDSASQTVRSMLQADLARSILTFALRQDEFAETDWDRHTGTIGHVAASLLARVFPDVSVKTLSERLDRDPDQFWSQIQAGVHFLGEVAS